MNVGEAAGWLLAMLAAYLSSSVQTVCNHFAGLRAHYRVEWRILGNGTWLVPDPGSTLHVHNTSAPDIKEGECLSKQLDVIGRKHMRECLPRCNRNKENRKHSNHREVTILRVVREVEMQPLHGHSCTRSLPDGSSSSNRIRRERMGSKAVGLCIPASNEGGDMPFKIKDGNGDRERLSPIVSVKFPTATITLSKFMSIVGLKKKPKASSKAQANWCTFAGSLRTWC
jgi:hypothetical protein